VELPPGKTAAGVVHDQPDVPTVVEGPVPTAKTKGGRTK
jgi:hypothetical protein